MARLLCAGVVDRSGASPTTGPCLREATGDLPDHRRLALVLPRFRFALDWQPVCRANSPRTPGAEGRVIGRCTAEGSRHRQGDTLRSLVLPVCEVPALLGLLAFDSGSAPRRIGPPKAD